MSTYKLKPTVVEAFNSLPPGARKALDLLLGAVEGKGEYIAAHQDDYGSYSADYGLTDWDIDISERADSLVSALSDLWDECQFCGQEIALTGNAWIGNRTGPCCDKSDNGGHLPKEEE